MVEENWLPARCLLILPYYPYGIVHTHTPMWARTCTHNNNKELRKEKDLWISGLEIYSSVIKHLPSRRKREGRERDFWVQFLLLWKQKPNPQSGNSSKDIKRGWRNDSVAHCSYRGPEFSSYDPYTSRGSNKFWLLREHIYIHDTYKLSQTHVNKIYRYEDFL